MPQLQAQLGRAEANQARLDRRLGDLDDLDTGRGWFGVLRRAVLAAGTGVRDTGTELRTRRFWWNLAVAVPAVLGIAVAVAFGEQLRGGALDLPVTRAIPTTAPWLVALLGLAPALIAAVRTVWSTLQTSGDQLQQRRTDNATDRYATHRGLLGRVSADLHRLNDALATQNDPTHCAVQERYTYLSAGRSRTACSSCERVTITCPSFLAGLSPTRDERAAIGFVAPARWVGLQPTMYASRPVTAAGQSCDAV